MKMYKSNACFRDALHIEAVLDEEADFGDNDTLVDDKPEYMEIADPTSADYNLLNTECSERKVMKIACDQLGKNLITCIFCILLIIIALLLINYNSVIFLRFRHYFYIYY